MTIGGEVTFSGTRTTFLASVIYFFGLLFYFWLFCFEVFVSKDERFVFGCCHDRRVRCWSVETTEMVQEFSGHKDVVLCGSLLCGSEYLISGSNDGTMRIFPVQVYDKELEEKDEKKPESSSTCGDDPDKETTDTDN